MKKRIAYLAMLCILLTMFMNSTLAYFTAEETARNVISSGAVAVELVEKQLADNALADYPDGSISVMPGTEVSKIVSARNLEEPAWLRMAYTVTILDADGEKMDITADELGQIMDLNEDSLNWTYSDGWWYYNQALAAGEESKPLFTRVLFSGPEMTDKYQSCVIAIDVVAQAVQQVHNGDTVMDAAGWPTD